MEIHHWPELAIGFTAGLSLSVILMFVRSRTHGVLRIDRSNPDKDVYRIEIDDLDTLAKKRRVVLKVDPNADLSQN